MEILVATVGLKQIRVGWFSRYHGCDYEEKHGLLVCDAI
jgi:hypothetical protein